MVPNAPIEAILPGQHLLDKTMFMTGEMCNFLSICSQPIDFPSSDVISFALESLIMMSRFHLIFTGNGRTDDENFPSLCKPISDQKTLSRSVYHRLIATYCHLAEAVVPFPNHFIREVDEGDLSDCEDSDLRSSD